MYENYFVIYCREQGKPLVKVYEITTGNIRDINFGKGDSVFTLLPGSNLDYSAKDFTVIYSSPTVYEDTLKYSFETSKITLVNSKKIIGAPLKLNNFVTNRIIAGSYDGLSVPITLFHHKDIKKDRKNNF